MCSTGSTWGVRPVKGTGAAWNVLTTRTKAPSGLPQLRYRAGKGEAGRTQSVARPTRYDLRFAFVALTGARPDVTSARAPPQELRRKRASTRS